jgi:hypothetical protein
LKSSYNKSLFQIAAPHGSTFRGLKYFSVLAARQRSRRRSVCKNPRLLHNCDRYRRIVTNPTSDFKKRTGFFQNFQKFYLRLAAALKVLNNCTLRIWQLTQSEAPNRVKSTLNRLLAFEFSQLTRLAQEFESFQLIGNPILSKNALCFRKSFHMRRETLEKSRQYLLHKTFVRIKRHKRPIKLGLGEHGGKKGVFIRLVFESPKLNDSDNASRRHKKNRFGRVVFRIARFCLPNSRCASDSAFAGTTFVFINEVHTDVMEKLQRRIGDNFGGVITKPLGKIGSD